MSDPWDESDFNLDGIIISPDVPHLPEADDLAIVTAWVLEQREAIMSRDRWVLGV